MQSLFGVGAPEALLVGVVALVVFGPKGLADVSHCWPLLCAVHRQRSLIFTSHVQPAR